MFIAIEYSGNELREFLHWVVRNQDWGKMEEDLQGGGDNIVTEFATYEDFLDSQVRCSAESDGLIYSLIYSSMALKTMHNPSA